jgi:hypothetical protein
MQQRSISPFPHTFLRFQVLLVAVFLGVLAAGKLASLPGLLQPPGQPATPLAASAADYPAVQLPSLVLALREDGNAPHLLAANDVYMGPSRDYRVLGLLPRGSVEVTGRNETADWLAINFSSLRGWVPTSAVSGIADVHALDVLPPTLLQSR